jgi:hypothetical protein
MMMTYSDPQRTFYENEKNGLNSMLFYFIFLARDPDSEYGFTKSWNPDPIRICNPGRK